MARKTLALRKIGSVTLFPTSPFNFDATVHKPDHFTSGDNVWQKGIRWQTWQWEGKQLGLKFVNEGTVAKPKFRIDFYFNKTLGKETIDSLSEEVAYLYNLNLDLNPFYKKFGKDKVLGSVIRRWYGLRPGQPSSLYEYLIIGMVLQNATVRRSMQMFQALLQNYGKLLKYDGKKLWCFWAPGGLKNVTEDELRALKMGYRARSIKRVDDYFAERKINETELRKAGSDSQKEELLKIYGVGPATVWYIMFDVFHRWDVFEHVSPWEQKIYTKLFFDRDPEKPVSTVEILKYISKYRPFQHLVVHYIWEDLWWKRKNKHIPWLEKLIRV
jgi:3-methyladenine DNA glycosylase/8-oxoguanine DNA glycosylase